jgi:hypothetical protein
MTSAGGSPSTELPLPAPVARRFEAIVFDWDSLAVPDHHAGTTRIAASSKTPAQRGSSSRS